VTLGSRYSFQLRPHAQFGNATLTDSPTRVLWVFT
ncbi:MAG: Cro/Cl family transcriptional regulator, partial [Pseudomonas sp.]